MIELTLSITPKDAMDMVVLQQTLREFEKQANVRVQLSEYETISVRDEINQFIVNDKSPDVSQLGSTWLRGMTDMNALRPFTPYDTAQMGNPDDFIQPNWKSTFMPENPSVQWGIPWLADVRMIYYRKDLLKKAGIEEQGAFANPEVFDQTLQQLQSSGVAIPWVVPSQHSWRSLHNIASWVWGLGGEFIDSTGKKILFDQPKALAGFKAYFALGRFLTGPARGLTNTESDTLFVNGDAAVTISGPHLLGMSSPELLEQIGFTETPGPSFIGGSHLVIWKNTRHVHEALQLVQALTSAATQNSFGLGGMLPVRLEALAKFSQLAGCEETFMPYMHHALANGRTFYSPYLWDIIETRLVNALVSIWEEIFKSPTPDLDSILQGTIPVLAHRLNATLDTEFSRIKGHKM